MTLGNIFVLELSSDHTLKIFRPHIYNLNFDPQLSCRIIHIIQKPETSIGNRKGHESDICMVGPG